MKRRALSVLQMLLTGVASSALATQATPAREEVPRRVRLELELRGDGWQDLNERFDFRLWLSSENRDLAAHLDPQIRKDGHTLYFHGGKTSIEEVPIGVHYQVYAPFPKGYFLESGVVHEDGDGVARVNLEWKPWPAKSQGRRGFHNMHRPIDGRCLDPEEQQLDATSIAAWTFHRAGAGWHRWFMQTWNWDSTEELRGGPAGNFHFDLAVLHGRPDPGELVLGLRDDRKGMPWLARIPLDAEADALGLDLGDVRMIPTERLAAGVVVDDRGKPVPHAIVWIEAIPSAPDAWDTSYPITSPLGCARAFADERGRFEIYGISELDDFEIYACSPPKLEHEVDLGDWISEWFDDPAPLAARRGAKDHEIPLSR